ncbi:inorganic phosphate transporter [Xylanibacillus composti]|uniref:Inorganic phosphate transporter n=1 Tax=Xylanibacillus composti TaxID=1572762 RepID=A0A8J4M100_9BACL|nr:inorganic phosphate transporter [Xylanibacillus composti]MDT9725501.1 inorganic phosphate transporter [Xylanibacillus composti]GIQ67595.1 inorganic phosphate transporter [Xylanibacillus composti]
MLEGFSLLVIIVIIMALVFDFTNGWNDSANAIATVVGTRVLKPLPAVLLAAVLNLAGAFAFTAVAKMISQGIVDPQHITLYVVVALLAGSITWNILMTLIGMPISASHSLIGGIIGAAVAHGGFGILIMSGVQKVLIAMLVSPIIGAVLAYLIMKLLLIIVGGVQPSKVKKSFGILQLVSVSWMAFSHGSSDAQKAMGIIMMALVAGGVGGITMDDPIPFWVITSCGLAIAFGTAIGGWKVIKTLGMRLSKLEPIHGFAAETAAAMILTTVSKIGIPVSSTHTITGAIIGVGMTGRLSSVRWGIAGKIVSAWIFTLPGTALIAFLSYKLLVAIGIAG